MNGWLCSHLQDVNGRQLSVPVRHLQMPPMEMDLEPLFLQGIYSLNISPQTGSSIGQRSRVMKR
jgi:hypothetical protein